MNYYQLIKENHRALLQQALERAEALRAEKPKKIDFQQRAESFKPELIDHIKVHFHIFCEHYGHLLEACPPVYFRNYQSDMWKGIPGILLWNHFFVGLGSLHQDRMYPPQFHIGAWISPDHSTELTGRISLLAKPSKEISMDSLDLESSLHFDLRGAYAYLRKFQKHTIISPSEIISFPKDLPDWIIS